MKDQGYIQKSCKTSWILPWILDVCFWSTQKPKGIYHPIKIIYWFAVGFLCHELSEKYSKLYIFWKKWSWFLGQWLFQKYIIPVGFCISSKMHIFISRWENEFETLQKKQFPDLAKGVGGVTKNLLTVVFKFWGVILIFKNGSAT